MADEEKIEFDRESLRMYITINTQAYKHNEEDSYGRIRCTAFDFTRSLYMPSLEDLRGGEGECRLLTGHVCVMIRHRVAPLYPVGESVLSHPPLYVLWLRCRTPVRAAVIGACVDMR